MLFIPLLGFLLLPAANSVAIVPTPTITPGPSLEKRIRAGICGWRNADIRELELPIPSIQSCH